MGRKRNLLQWKSFNLILIFFVSSVGANQLIDASIKKHQNTFENIAMDIWDLSEVGYQEYQSSKIDRKSVV